LKRQIFPIQQQDESVWAENYDKSVWTEGLEGTI